MAKLVRANGVVEPLMPAEHSLTLQEMYDAISTDIVELVFPLGLNCQTVNCAEPRRHHHVMIVDEEGRLKQNHKVNFFASQLYNPDGIEIHREKGSLVGRVVGDYIAGDVIFAIMMNIGQDDETIF